ncbi:hypothetical protein [Ideonella sp. B508-1]|uniref:hypothetical protein n=1 Tax=Ideonella sp. B508-1 TaxID=137716 RepID=UPI00034B5A64|nr:hypothetical protein [Ideonella sp. B508-1]
MSTLLRTFFRVLRRWLPAARPGLPTQARELRDLGLGDGELGYWLRQTGAPRRLVDEPAQD